MTTPGPDYQARIDQAAAYIARNLKRRLSLEEVARQGGLSPSHFYRLFTALVGEPPQDYASRLRLEKAAALLVKSPSLAVAQVVYACGYSSSIELNLVFKERFGVTAAQYASAGRAGDPPQARLQTGSQEGQDQVPGENFLARVRFQVMPPLNLAYITNQYRYYPPDICRAWIRLHRWAATRRLLTPDTLWVGISYDDPRSTLSECYRCHTCITVIPGRVADLHAETHAFPGGECAIFPLECTLAQVESAYRSIYSAWLPGSGRQLGDFPGFEIYRALPNADPQEKNALEICIPLQAP